MAGPGRRMFGQVHHTGRHHCRQKRRAALGKRDRSQNWSRVLDVVERGIGHRQWLSGSRSSVLTRNRWWSHGSFQGIGHNEVFNTALWVITLLLDVAMETRDTLQQHGVKMVAVFSNTGCNSRNGTPGARPRAAISQVVQ